jgi:hypothetical protein
MARIKNFCGFELKTGGLIIGYVSFFANILYLIACVEAVLICILPQSEERKKLFGSYLNELDTSTIAFPIILFGVVASLYGVIASLFLICGVKKVSSITFLTFSLTHSISLCFNSSKKKIRNESTFAAVISISINLIEILFVFFFIIIIIIMNVAG